MPAYVSSTDTRPMPNLENLKKQAKLYLRWHRDQHYPVAARIRAVLPSFRHLSDREVFAHSFRLSDAQELIARKTGFESWEALRAGVQTMSAIGARGPPLGQQQARVVNGLPYQARRRRGERHR